MDVATPILKTTGIISVAVGGVTASFAPEDLSNWLQVLSSFSPILLCGILLYWVWRIDKHHRECRSNVSDLTSQLIELKVRVAVLTAGNRNTN